MENVGIMCYKSLLEMEAENRKINEMMMAPKFAKILDESADADDFAIHRAKTIETISEFVNKSFDNISNLLNTISEQMEFNTNTRLISACEMKMKSLTREDRDNLVIENRNIQKFVSEAENEISKDIQSVTEALTKILESSLDSKEEYRASMHTFRELISRCKEKLNKVDISESQRYDVTVEDIPGVLNTYKGFEAKAECDKSSLSSSSKKFKECKESVNSKNLVKVKEAVYLGAEYLMRANSVVSDLVTISHENAQDILTKFVTCESEGDIQFEGAMRVMMNQSSVEDDDDFEIR